MLLALKIWLYSYTPTIFAVHNAVLNGRCRTEQQRRFLGLPKWYSYLNYRHSDVTNRCEIDAPSQVFLSGYYWLIGLAILDILLSLAGLISVGFLIYGGFKYLTSQGEPNELVAARRTIINALIGAVIAVIAVRLVGFAALVIGGNNVT